jgi:hypothetical protein
MLKLKNRIKNRNFIEILIFSATHREDKKGRSTLGQFLVNIWGQK